MNLLERVKRQRIALSAPAATVTKLSYHPELDGRTHLYSSIDNNAGAVLEDFAGYARVYGVYPWVHKAITKIIDNIAGLPVVVVNADGETQDNHWLTDVFANVNDTHSALDLWAADVIHLMLGGESAIQVVPDGRGRPVELWARRPDLVGVSPDVARGRYPSIAKFTYGPHDGETPLELPPEQMIWRKFLNPLNDYRGLAPITAVREGIIIDLFAQQWSKGFLKNSARPDFALVAPQGITPTEKSDYEARFMRRHRGIDGAHLPVILEEGITDIKTFSFPPKDIEWLQQREYSRDEVGAIFGVPDEIMGYGRDTYENFQTALEVFWTLTLLPYVRRRDVALTTFFARHYAGILRPGERVETDVSEISTLQEDAAPKVDIAVKLWRMGVDFNTLDERLNLGIGAVPGGEVAYVDSSVVPLEQIAATLAQMQTALDNMRNPQPAPVQDMPPDAPDDDADDVQRSAAWRAEAKTFRKWLRRNGDKDSSEFVAQHLSEDDKRAIMAEVADSSTAFFQVTRPKCWNGRTIPDAAESVAAWKALVLQMDDGDDEAERRAREAIEAAAAADIADALERQRRALLPANVTLANADDVARRVSETSGSVRDALRRMLIESADLGVSVAVAQFDTIGYGFDWTLVNVAARDWANRHAGELITLINDTTRNQVRQAVAAWIENGDPLPALIRELAPVFGGERAKLIAATEVTRAYAESNRLAYIESGVVEEIEFRNSMDERTCPICGPRGGRRTSVTNPDFDGYGLPPLHPRCRCWVVPVINN